MALKTEYLIGKITDTTWTGVYGNRPIDQEEFERLGEVYGVMRFSTDVEDFAIDTFAKVIIKSFEQAYFEDLKDYKSTLERLEESCWKMKAKMDMLLSREKELAEVGIDLEMALLVFKDKYLYAVVIGESKIFISREDNLVDITEGLIDTTKTGFIKSASLEILQEDKFALLTSKINSNFDEIENSINNLDISLLDNELNEGSSMMFIANESLEWNKNKEVEEIVSEEFVNQELEENIAQNHDFIEQDEELVEEDENFEQVLDEGLSQEKSEELEEDFDDEYEEEGEKIGFAERLSSVKDSLLSRFNKKDTAEIDEEDNTYEDEEQEEKGGIFNKVKSIVLGAYNGVRNHFKDNQTTYVHAINKVLENVKKLFREIKRQFDIHVLGKQLDRQRRAKRNIKRNRIIFAVVVFVVAIFLYNSFQGAQRNRREKKATEEVEVAVQTYESSLNQLKSQVSINQFSDAQTKNGIAASLNKLQADLNKEKTNITNNKDVRQKDIFGQRINTALMQIQSQQDLLMLFEEIDNPTIIADVASTYQSADVTDMVMSGNYILLADKARDVIYRVRNDASGSIEEFISSVTEPYLLTKNVAGEVIFYDNDRTAVAGKFNVEDASSVTRFTNMTPPSVGNVKSVAVYSGNDALYELRPQNNYVFRRDKVADGYATGGMPFQPTSASTWRVDDTFGRAIDIATPYEIYVLVTGLGLRRHSAGGENTLEANTYLNLLDDDREAIKSATAFDATFKYVAVGDSVNKRILFFEIIDNDQKSLRFIKQIGYRGNAGYLGNIKSITVNDETKTAYVLDGNRVLRVNF